MKFVEISTQFLLASAGPKTTLFCISCFSRRVLLKYKIRSLLGPKNNPSGPRHNKVYQLLQRRLLPWLNMSVMSVAIYTTRRPETPSTASLPAPAGRICPRILSARCAAWVRTNSASYSCPAPGGAGGLRYRRASFFRGKVLPQILRAGLPNHGLEAL